MSIFEEIKVGDKIVLDTLSKGFGRRKHPLKIETVTKVTTTQITAGGVRFLKRNGHQIGDSYTYLVIKTKWTQGQGEHLMTLEEAEVYNRKVEQEKQHSDLVYKLRDFDYASQPYETLLQVAKILGLRKDSTNDNP